MPALMATAEYVTKVHAICVRCGNLAHHSHRLTADEKAGDAGRAGFLRTDLPPLLRPASRREGVTFGDERAAVAGNATAARSS